MVTKEDTLRSDALSDITWDIMHGKTLDAGYKKLTLWDVLLDAEHWTLAQAIIADMSEAQFLRDSVEKIVRERLNGSIWHQARMDYLQGDEDE